jgi:hypothetical protein
MACTPPRAIGAFLLVWASSRSAGHVASIGKHRLGIIKKTIGTAFALQEDCRAQTRLLKTPPRPPALMNGMAMPRKFRGGSSLEPKPAQRASIDEYAALAPEFSKI